MDRDKLIKQLMATFLLELEEHVHALNRDLLALENDPAGSGRAELLKSLFRSAHSLKGAARSVNVDVIEGACHRLEEILTAARDGQLPVVPELFALLFTVADAIEEAGMRLREQADLTAAPLAGLFPQLENALHGKYVARREKSRRSDTETQQTDDVKTPTTSNTSHRKDSTSPPTASSPELVPRPALTPTSAKVPEPAARESPASPSSPSPTVRVAAEKLDSLLAQSGELLVARRRVDARAETLSNLKEFVAAWQAEWRSAEKPVRQLLQLIPKVELPADHAQRMRSPSGESSASSPLSTSVAAIPPRAARVLARTADYLRRLEKDLDRCEAEIVSDGRQLDQVAGSLDDEVRRVRMLPFVEACQGLDRVAHDLARAAQKEVELVIEGRNVELDRSVLEALKDPLRHLVRNAVDHGVELPADRKAAGKAARARVTVSATLRGSHVEVVVGDDGRGLDKNALREQVQKRGLAEPADERELMRLIFMPGFSTAQIITDISGRGVGLDVVKSRVESLRGSVEFTSEPGHGSRFMLAVPLTLTTLRAILFRAGEHRFAFPSSNVLKLVRICPDELRFVEGREVLSLGGPPLPVVSLAATLGLGEHEPPAPGSKIPALIVSADGRHVVFVVDELLAEQEVVVKNLGARIRRVRNVSGAMLLTSGRIALLLNAANLVRTALSRPSGVSVVAVPAAQASEAKKRLLVVEDSVTTRTFVKSILEAAGYDVTVAVDGQAAWQSLQEKGADLIVSDVEMPRMDGFELTTAVRGSKRFQSVPLILVTARESEQDKAHGIEVGADAYLIKSAFDQRSLLETIAQLL